MKTNYGKLGQESIDLLKDTSKRAAEVQMRILAELMHRNRETVYGKKYGFGAIKTEIGRASCRERVLSHV